jgi:hypothetical protein
MAGNVASLSTVCVVARDVPWIRRVNPGPLCRRDWAGVSILAPSRRGLRIPYGTTLRLFDARRGGRLAFAAGSR